jgi:hypothetical protein
MWPNLPDILIASAIGWFFAEWYPAISTRAKEKRIQQITKRLHEYENDFADSRLFITRIVRISSRWLASLMFCFMIFQITELSIYSQVIICKLSADACSPLSQVSINSVVFQGLNFLSAFWAVFISRRFGLELRPNKYRSYMNDRIASLHRRLKTG